MIEWTCDRCKKRDSDHGVRFSNISPQWTSFCLTKITEEREQIETVVHLCDHCSVIQKAITVEINYPR